VLKQPLTDWHHFNLQGSGYVISNDHTPYSKKKGSTHRTKPLHEELLEEWEKHKLKGELQNRLHKSSETTCMKYPETRCVGELRKEGR